MKRYIVMLATCILASGGMMVILLVFLKRIKKIENDFWGDQKKAVKKIEGGDGE